MRQLIHIPIIHTAADLGSLSDSVKAHYAEKFGRGIWNRREQAVEKLWDDIRDKIEVLDLDCEKVRIYQDGLPFCGFEAKIVEELAEAGSRNHQLVLELVGNGAMLMGTEDPQLLMQEYELQKQCTENQTVSDQVRQQRIEQADRLLEARDRFIAKRVDETLRAGEIGLLFLGALHRLDALRSIDIQLETLVDLSKTS